MHRASGTSADLLIRRHDRVLAGLACTLCVSAQLKFAQIQLLEFIYALDLVLVSVWVASRQFPIRVFKPYFRLALHWALFSAFTLLLSIWALRRDFYLATDSSPLSGPLMVTASRLVELALDVSVMVYLASRCREDQPLCRFVLWFYCGIGFAGCIYGWFGRLLLVVGVHHGGADAGRMTGFNNEGGPFGVYLVSVMAALIALRQERWIGVKSCISGMILLLASILASESKAALFEIVVFATAIAFLKLRLTRAIQVAASVCLVAYIVLLTTGLGQVALGYLRLADKYRTVSHVSRTDMNFVAGRVAGIYLVPKMIAAHPMTGIGLGNYPMVRDAPQYRQGSAIIGLPLDSPSLGFLDYLVELGFPLFLYLTYIQVSPAAFALRHGGGVGTVALILVLPISVWLGAHLNLTYMWILVAVGLALSFRNRRSNGKLLAPHGFLESVSATLPDASVS